MDKIIDEYINNGTWRIRENANTNFSLSGLKSHIASSILAKDAIYSMPSLARQYHNDGFMHCHDLDGGRYSPYCLGADLLKLVQCGINTIGATSRPAKHFDVLIDHIVNITYMYTQEWNGAIAWRDFDILGAPFIRYDNLSYDQVKQNIQRLVFNLSYPLRAAYQNPFSNITFALKPPSYYKDMNVIVGGKSQKETYSEFQNEIDMINLAFCDVMIEGDSYGRPHTFPLPTYNITEDFDWNSEVSDKIFMMASKYGLPYFANYIGNKDYKVEDSVSMCCRLRLRVDEINRVSGGTWNYGSNTGSLAVCTINLAIIAYLSNNNEIFIQKLDDILLAAKEYLLWKKEQIKLGFDLGLMPTSKNYLHTLDTFFLTIGTIAMNEASINLFGTDIIENVDWCEKVNEYVANKVLEFQRETGQLFNFEATPAEGASYRLARINKKMYPDIYTQGNDDEVYYTGSSLIPAHYDISLVDALQHQSRLQQSYTGGSVFHIDTGEFNPGGKSVKELIKKVCENTKLPYITWSPSYSICPVHGRTAGKECCDQAEVYSRIVGYIRPVHKWNKGKRKEFENKKFYKI